MMTDDDHPVLMGILQCLIQPLQFSLAALLMGVGICDTIIAILVNQRRSIEENDAELATFILKDLGIITLLETPAAADFRIVENGLCVAAVFMITENRIPKTHQFGMTVDIFIVCTPQRVVDTLYSVEMMDVTDGDDGLHADFLGEVAHGSSAGFLVVIAIAAHIIAPQQIDRLRMKQECAHHEEKERHKSKDFIHELMLIENNARLGRPQGPRPTEEC